MVKKPPPLENSNYKYSRSFFRNVVSYYYEYIYPSSCVQFRLCGCPIMHEVASLQPCSGACMCTGTSASPRQTENKESAERGKEMSVGSKLTLNIFTPGVSSMNRQKRSSRHFVHERNQVHSTGTRMYLRERLPN